MDSTVAHILNGGTNYLQLKSSTGTIYKIQWGAQQVTSDGTHHITFPIAFSSQSYTALRSAITTSREGITYRVVSFSNNLTTGIDFYATTLTPWVFWLVIGI